MMPSKVDSYNDDMLATDDTTADDNFDIAHPFYRDFARYAQLYQKYPALRNGRQSTIYAQPRPGVFAIERSLDTLGEEQKNLLVVFNTSAEKQDLSMLPVDDLQPVYQSNPSDAGEIAGLSVQLYLME